MFINRKLGSWKKETQGRHLGSGGSLCIQTAYWIAYSKMTSNSLDLHAFDLVLNSSAEASHGVTYDSSPLTVTTSNNRCAGTLASSNNEETLGFRNGGGGGTCG